MSMNWMSNGPVKQASMVKSSEPHAGHTVNNLKGNTLIAILPTSLIQKCFTGFNNVKSH